MALKEQMRVADVEYASALDEIRQGKCSARASKPIKSLGRDLPEVGTEPGVLFCQDVLPNKTRSFCKTTCP